MILIPGKVSYHCTARTILVEGEIVPVNNPIALPPRFGTPFRVGSTSYVYADDILPNVEKLAAAGEVDDIELILFEVDDGPNNIPSEAIIQQIDGLARAANITYTVHLPLDLTLAADGSAQHASLIKAQRVIERTLPLDPFAFVFHLDGKGVESPGWVDNALRALEVVMGGIPDPARLAVENLENYPPDYLDPVLARAPISRTTDIGHFWKMGLNPLDYLPAWLPRTRVIHIHGMAERDHHSLALMTPEQLDPVVGLLIEAQYSGVVTLEVFETMDFFTSQAALFASVDREGQSGIIYSVYGEKRSSEDLIKLAIDVPEWDMARLPIYRLHKRTDRQTFEQSAALCHSEDSDERMVGAYILGQIGYDEERPFEEETLDILLNMLETEQNTDVIDSVLNALGFISNERTIDPVLKWKDHPDDSIRFHVVFNCTFNDERVIQALLQFSRDPDNDVRDWACMWLGNRAEEDSTREDIRAALWERIEVDDQDGGYGEALVGLAAMQDRRVNPHILKWLRSGEAGQLIYYAAFEAIDKGNDPELLREILAIRDEWANNPDISQWQKERLESLIADLHNRS
jgi:sugar phosphate isomerase/epimerase/HEAT repeat protein